jgi:hypothetical protein
MFDTPDLGPLFLAPLVGLTVGVVVFALISKVTKAWRSRRWLLAAIPALVITPIAALASFTLRLGEGDPTPWFQPRAQDVVGTWHLTTDTSIYLRLFAGYTPPSHSLDFHEDGTFTLSRVPNFWVNLTDPAPTDSTEFMATGFWSIESRFDHPIVLLRFDTISVEDAEREVPLYFEGHAPPYRLVERAGHVLNPMLRFRRSK